MKTNYTILPQNVADNGTLKGCIFVGANASGKSTVIFAVKLLLDLLFLERSLNSGIFICMFGERCCYSLSYEFLIRGKRICYSFEVSVVRYLEKSGCQPINDFFDVFKRKGIDVPIPFVEESLGIEKMYVSGVFGGLPEYREVDHEV